MDTKTRPVYICCLLETHFRTRDTYRLKVKGWKRLHVNGNQEKAGVTILISDKIDFKIKNIIRDKEGHYIMIKGSVQEEDITIVNIHAANIGAPQYIRQTLTGIRREIDSNTIIVVDFNTPLTSLDRSSKQRINKEIETLNETLDQMNLTDILRTFHQMQKNTLSSQGHMEHSSGQTTSWVKNQASVNLRKLKSYQVFCLTTEL